MIIFQENNKEYSLIHKKMISDISFLEKNTGLSESEKITYSKFSNIKRKTEWLNARYILQNDFKIPAGIIYDKEGKPSLSNGTNISISHSANEIAIIVSKEHNVALDLEFVREKILRIKHKFLHQSDKELIAKLDSEIQALTLVWSAKETMLKLYGKKDLIFDTQMQVFLSGKNLSGIISNRDFEKNIQLNYILNDKTVLVWAVDK